MSTYTLQDGVIHWSSGDKSIGKPLPLTIEEVYDDLIKLNEAVTRKNAQLINESLSNARLLAELKRANAERRMLDDFNRQLAMDIHDAKNEATRDRDALRKEQLYSYRTYQQRALNETPVVGRD